MLPKSTSVKGFEEDRIIYASNFANSQDAIEYVVNLGDWYDLISAGSATCTATVGDSDIVVASGALFSDGKLRVGDIWSPDGGTWWYNVLAVPDNDTITLRCPLQVANISGIACVIARPKYRKLILDAGSTLTTLWGFSETEALTPYLHIVNQGGLTFFDPGDEISANNIIRPPHQGVIVNHGIFIDTSFPNDVAAGVNYAALAPTGLDTHKILHLAEYGVNYRTHGVDLFPPATFGSVEMHNSYYENGSQDMMQCAPTGLYEIYDSTIVARAALIGGAALVPIIFQQYPSIMQRTTARLDNSKQVPGGQAHMGTALNEPGNGDPAVWDDCVFQFMSANASELVFFSGTNGESLLNMTLNRCTLDATAVASGNVEIVKSATYTGAASLTLNQCPQVGGWVDGGGGDLTITTNA